MTRINSTRLPAKALLEIEGKPIIIHTFKRAQMSKLADDIYVCTDSEKLSKFANILGLNLLKQNLHIKMEQKESQRLRKN